MSNTYLRDPNQAFDDAIEAGVLTRFSGHYIYMCSVIVPGGVDDQFKHWKRRKSVHNMRLGADPTFDKRWETER